MKTWLLLIVTVVLWLYPMACGNSIPVTEDPALNKLDQEILDQVRTFATDEGSLGNEAWIRLTAYNRDTLLSSLRRLLRSSKVADFEKSFVAFTLCNLNVDYSENREFIVATFNHSLNYASSLERIISRLIDKGDSDLLVPLFEMSVKADGDLSEGLADTFAKQIQTEPQRFLTLTKDEPIQIRRRVYEFVILGTSDERRIRKYLADVPKDSPLWKVAQEMLDAMSRSGRTAS